MEDGESKMENRGMENGRTEYYFMFWNASFELTGTT
jgi:hypothetical protein